MIIYGYDLDEELKNKDNITQSVREQYIHERVEEIKEEQLKDYRKLVRIGYVMPREGLLIKNVNNILFNVRVYTKKDYTFELNVLYQALGLKILFNGDGEYHESMTIKGELNLDNITKSENKLIKKFNDELKKLMINIKCNKCTNKATMIGIYDPYLKDVEGIEEQTNLCDQCYERRCDDI